MTSSPASRDKRVAERIRADLSALLIRGELRDPDLEGAIISAVEVTADLSLARVYVRLLSVEVDAQARRKLLDALDRAKGFLRREIGRTLKVRRVPELRFAWDDGSDRAAKIEQLLAEVRSEAKPTEESPVEKERTR